MTRRFAGLMLFVGGCVVGLAMATLFGGGAAMPEALAQAPGAAGPAGQYWISSWGDGTNHGAYVIDTQSGKVWSVVQGSPLQSHGGPTENPAQ